MESWEEYIAAEEIQNIVWQSPDRNIIVPASFMKTVHKNGGVMLGAFLNQRMIGFVFGGASFEGGKENIKLKQYSHMLAVLPEYRNLKIGERLKFKQREFVLDLGLNLITWTFDPLQAVNATLNFSRLGTIARRYKPDVYGEMTDIINLGLPSDRFEVEWWLDSFRVKQHAVDQTKSKTWNSFIENGAQPTFDIIFDNQNLPHINQEAKISGDTIFVEIPSDINKLKNSSLALAQEWRMSTRDLFQRLFADGFVVMDFMIINSNIIKRCAHVLTREHTKLQEILNDK